MHMCTDGSMHVCINRGGPACLLRKRSVSRERSDVCKCTCAKGGLCTCARVDEGQYMYFFKS